VQNIIKKKNEINPKEICNSRLINSSPEKIFLAFFESKHLQNWWGPKGFSNTFKEFNFSNDGVWDFIMHGPDGRDYKNKSIFLEIIRPKKIVIEHITTPHFILTVTLDAEDDKTSVGWSALFKTIKLRNNIAKYAMKANEENFDRLEKVITLIK
jgi:uncharacterized protein YndB with AHSA1/START domain